MKKFKFLLLLICSFLLLSPTKASGQTILIGHVSAEVVQSSSFSTDVTSEISIDSISITSNFVFAQIVVMTKKHSSCYIVSSPSMSNNQKNAINSYCQTFNLTQNITVQERRLAIDREWHTIVLAYN